MNVSIPRISSTIIASVTGNTEVTERRALNPIPTALNNQRSERMSPYQMPGRSEGAAPRRLNSPIFADIERRATGGENQGFMSRIFGGNRVEAGNSINNNA